MFKKSFYLIFFFAFVVCGLSKGQGLISNYEFGYHFDNNQVLMPGYYDFDYEPKKTEKVHQNYAVDFAPGYYIDDEGLRVHGFIKHNLFSKSFEFKNNLTDKKGFKMTANECIGYVIGLDSFIVTNKNLLEYDSTNTLIINRQNEFIQYLDRVGDLTFYKMYYQRKVSHSTLMSHFVVFYLMKHVDSTDFIKIPNGILKFQKFGKDFFKDYNYVINQINKLEFRSSDMESLIKVIKYAHLHSRGQNVYFNYNWKEIINSSGASYFAEIISFEDSTFRIKYSTIDSIPLYEGSFSSLYPHFKHGEFFLYYPDGSVRKKVSYKDNVVKHHLFYYPNGKKHMEVIRNWGIDHYFKVYDDNERNILDEKGTGSISFIDPVLNRLITFEIEKHLLKRAFYTDKQGGKIYQVCDSNAKFIKNKEMKYPLAALYDKSYGVVLVRVLIDPEGLVKEIEILRGVDRYTNELVFKTLQSGKNSIEWNSGKVGKGKVFQEIIVPFDFAILSSSPYNNYFFHFQNHMNMMNQQMMMMF
jgi:hypothetical protein